jgi:hypothetical protein
VTLDTYKTTVAGDIDFSSDNWCVSFDCHRIYVHTKGKGLVTIAKTDGLSKDIGHVLQSSDTMKDSQCSMLALGSKLLIRSYNSGGRPFTVVDPTTLKGIEGPDLDAFN